MPITSVKNIAQITGLSSSTVRQLCDKGMIEYERDCKGWRCFPEPKRTIKQVKSLFDKGILKSRKMGKLYNKDNPGLAIVNMISGKRRICYWVDNGKTKRVYHYRWLWEKRYGAIPKGYVIHHKDGDTLNDSLDNLELMVVGKHSRVHRKGQGASTYQSWVSFLSKHNKMDIISKAKLILQVKFDGFEGKDIAKKFENIFNKYMINQAEFPRLSGISKAMLSRVISGSRIMGRKTLIAVFNTINDLNINL